MAVGLWRSVIAFGAAGATVVVAQTSVAAVPAWADDHFKVCVTSNPCPEYVEGTIKWGNRTATVTTRLVGGYGVSAHFDAFAGSTKVDSHSQDYPFGGQFTIGDPNRVGGINRIRTQACFTGEGQSYCGRQWNDIRD